LIYLCQGGRIFFHGEDHSDDWCRLDVVVSKCDGAKKVGARGVLRGRPREAVPEYPTGTRQALGLHQGAH
jgi:hypothetical protein